METIRTFEPGDRYKYDFNECRSSNGWAQIDTQQDAWYFGIWCSPKRREILTYAEGDVIREIAETDEEFVAAIRRLEAWAVNDGQKPIKIDPGTDPEMTAEFERIGLADLLY